MRLAITCALALCGLAGACGDGSDLILVAARVGDAGASADAPSPSLAPARLPAHCNPDAAPPATTLECTGLYGDLASKQLAPGVEAYAPAVVLWSDGSDKRRWVSLPPGATIDASNPNEWVFPVGTRFWKEFAEPVAGRRIETRLWQKVASNFWVHATYAWNAEESAAVRTAGGDIPVGDGTYHIPTKDECEKCHRGRSEHILGFDQVSLGLPGATGLTLAELDRRQLLSPGVPATALAIGDDGTGVAAPALGWLHANCGTTCHNDNPGATAYGAKMRLRLDPRQLDGRSLADIDIIRTTVGVTVNAPNWNGRVRIVPGDPVGSLLYDLITHRGTGDQMPPFASQLVDPVGTALIADWISRMPAPVEQ